MTLYIIHKLPVYEMSWLISLFVLNEQFSITEPILFLPLFMSFSFKKQPRIQWIDNQKFWCDANFNFNGLATVTKLSFLVILYKPTYVDKNALKTYTILL